MDKMLLNNRKMKTTSVKILGFIMLVGLACQQSGSEPEQSVELLSPSEIQINLTNFVNHAQWYNGGFEDNSYCWQIPAAACSFNECLNHPNCGMTWGHLPFVVRNWGFTPGHPVWTEPRGDMEGQYLSAHYTHGANVPVGEQRVMHFTMEAYGGHPFSLMALYKFFTHSNSPPNNFPTPPENPNRMRIAFRVLSMTQTGCTANNLQTHYTDTFEGPNITSGDPRNEGPVYTYQRTGTLHSDARAIRLQANCWEEPGNTAIEGWMKWLVDHVQIDVPGPPRPWWSNLDGINFRRGGGSEQYGGHEIISNTGYLFEGSVRDRGNILRTDSQAVQLRIRRTSDDRYWDGSNFVVSETWVSATLGSSWSTAPGGNHSWLYNFTYPGAGVFMISLRSFTAASNGTYPTNYTEQCPSEYRFVIIAPTPTNTPIHTNTPTNTPTATNTPTSTPTATPDSLSHGLIACWSLDEEEGIRHDSIGTSDLSPENNPGVVWAVVGNGAAFTGSEALYNNSVSVMQFGNTCWTTAFWVNLAEKPAHNMPLLTRRGNASTGSEYSIFWDSSSDRFMFTLFDGDESVVGFIQANNLGSPQLDEWYLVFCWHDSINQLMGISVFDPSGNPYTNTAPLGWMGVPGTASNVRFFLAREDNASGQYLNGVLDQVFFWNRVVGAGQQADLYNSGLGLDCDLNTPSFTPSPTPTNTPWLGNGLIACWSLDEEEGIRYDSIGTNNLTPENDPGFAWAVVGNGAVFNRFSQQSLYHNHPEVMQFGNADFTIAFWVKLTHTSTQNMPLVTRRGDTDNGSEYAIYYDGAFDRLGFAIFDGGTNPVGFVPAGALGSPMVGAWYLVFCWYDSGIPQIGISVFDTHGTPQTNTAGLMFGTPGKAANTRFFVGREDHAETPYLDGILDQIFVWERVVTPAQRLELYNAGLGLDCALNTPDFTPSPTPQEGPAGLDQPYWNEYW